MDIQPTNLTLEGKLLRIEWSDGKSILYDPIQLRQHCPCVTCNSERTQAAAEGKVPESSGAPVTITGMEPTGNYAYKITFSDGHSTGLFTLEFCENWATTKADVSLALPGLAMKEVTIYSIGSCDTATRKGRYCVSLQYGEHVKYLSADVSDTTANRCIILGLLAAVDRLKEPCLVTLVTSTAIGVQKGETAKGPNGDLVKSLLQALALGRHDANFDVWSGRAEELKARWRPMQKRLIRDHPHG